MSTGTCYLYMVLVQHVRTQLYYPVEYSYEHTYVNSTLLSIGIIVLFPTTIQATEERLVVSHSMYTIHYTQIYIAEVLLFGR